MLWGLPSQLERQEALEEEDSGSRSALALTRPHSPWPGTTEKTKPTQKFKLAEWVEHYDERATCMKVMTEQSSELCNEECNLLSVAYKNMVGGHRPAWRVIFSTERRPTSPTRGCS